MIDAAWIDFWSAMYPVAEDARVLNEVGPRVRERGYYDRSDLIEVGNWKSQRVGPLLRSNTDAMIADITRTAFAAPLSIQHSILTLLHGVGVPMASALLMVWRPEVHTVIDVRALATLRACGEIDTAKMAYVDYLATCKSISQRSNRDLRTVDRALFQANGSSQLG